MISEFYYYDADLAAELTWNGITMTVDCGGEVTTAHLCIEDAEEFDEWWCGNGNNDPIDIEGEASLRAIVNKHAQDISTEFFEKMREWSA